MTLVLRVEADLDAGGLAPGPEPVQLMGEPRVFQEGPQLLIKRAGQLGPWREEALDISVEKTEGERKPLKLS